MTRAASFFALICISSFGQDPRFTGADQLVRPENYREWIYVTSGLGMTYGPTAPRVNGAPMFDNIFVHPDAYRAFKETGKWPDKTIFVLEIRGSESHGSINKDGNYQKDLVAVEAAVKDEKRFPEKWAYFGFGRGGALTPTATAYPKGRCFTCHQTNGASDNTFLQFYPTLHEVAKTKGTLKPATN